MSRLRMTYPTGMVLQALAAGYRYGFDVASATGVRPGSVYQILHRLEEAAMVEGAWEDAELAHAEGRPSRRYYRLTPVATEAVEEARTRFPALASLPHGVATDPS